MKAYLRLFPALILLISFGCCSDSGSFRCTNTTAEPEIMRNTQFNHKTVIKLRMGMTLNEFEGVFGPPDRSSSNTLEAKVATAAKQMVYEYDMGKHPDAHYPEVFGVNKFYFNIESDPPALERWDIDYVY
ncbi:MAG: hypothetical protein WAW37_15105 [Syntrophobacteraceae bacterium]